MKLNLAKTNFKKKSGISGKSQGKLVEGMPGKPTVSGQSPFPHTMQNKQTNGEKKPIAKRRYDKGFFEAQVGKK